MKEKQSAVTVESVVRPRVTVKDVKGFETETFRVKERLMKVIYGIEIKKT